MDDYDVYTDEDDYIGSVELKDNACWQDMPTELEINGYIYKLET